VKMRMTSPMRRGVPPLNETIMHYFFVCLKIKDQYPRKSALFILLKQPSGLFNRTRKTIKHKFVVWINELQHFINNLDYFIITQQFAFKHFLPPGSCYKHPQKFSG